MYKLDLEKTYDSVKRNFYFICWSTWVLGLEEILDFLLCINNEISYLI